jgi:oxygen-dependent protoporphyrinogen oxidase
VTPGGPGAPLDVAVVGGGISGLAAAWELGRRGLRARVLEAGAHPGGVIRTTRLDDWVIDEGPDALLAQKPAGVDLCRELGLAERLVPTLLPRTAWIQRNGRLLPIAEGSFLGFPVRLGALARSPLFSLAGKLRVAGELLVPRAADDGDESVGAFVRRRFGQQAVDRLAEPLLAGIHAGAVDRLSMRALFPRLVEVEQRHGSVLRGARALARTTSPRGAFVSLPGGTGELVDALQQALGPDVVALATRVTELRRAGGYIVETDRGPVAAMAVLLAVPAWAAAGLLRGFDTTLAGLCDTVPYASTATVAFGYRREQVRHPLAGSGYVVPRTERSPLLAATWVSSKWPGRAPDGCVLLRGFLGGARDPRRLEHDDADLVHAARETLSATLGIEGAPLLTRLSRWTRQSPQHEVGHLDRVATIDARLAAQPGLYLTGSGFRAVGIPDCIADGRAQAARIADFLAAPAR